jgi:general secretion pathway protein C
MLNLSLRDRTLPRAITMTSVALSALFMAQGASYLAAISLLHIALQLPAAPSPNDHAPLFGTEPPDRTAILARNIFDSMVGSLWPKQLAKVCSEPEMGAMPPLCDGSLRMSGAMWSAFSPWQSLAMLGTDANTELYRAGMPVNGKELVQIMPSAAVLRRRDGHLCSVAMFGHAARAPVDDSMAGSDHAVGSDDIDRGIRARSETSFVIDRALVDRIASDPMRLITERIVPHEEAGRVVGVKLYGIRRGSLLAKLGVDDGDLLRTVNGIGLSAPSGALAAYGLLRSASHLSLAIVRRGQPMTLEYDLH